MDKKICHKCNKKKPISQFRKFFRGKDRKEELCETSCHDCHYKRNIFWKNASEKEKLERIKELFNKMVIKDKEGCWGWKGKARSKGGYCNIHLGKSEKPKQMKAHRVSWILHYGFIPKNMCVCHKCDVPHCTNPTHLFLGTYKDNNFDKEKKGRGNHPIGNKHGKSKLKEDDVKKIKKLLRLNMPIEEIAKNFGATLTMIRDIKKGRTWKHIK